MKYSSGIGIALVAALFALPHFCHAASAAESGTVHVPMAMTDGLAVKKAVISSSMHMESEKNFAFSGAQSTAKSTGSTVRAFAGGASQSGISQSTRGSRILSARVTWKPVPNAVKYQVVLLKSADDTPENIALTLDNVFETGVDIPLRQFGSDVDGFYWKVCALDYYGNAIGHFSRPLPIAKSGEINARAPLPTTQFNEMSYSPEYPVYSWIPVAGVKKHIVEVRRESNGAIVRSLGAGEFDVYDSLPFLTPGTYSWRVRGLAMNGEPITEWSEPSKFCVTTPTPFAALGDSITHGGGVMSVPPGYLLYNWETYCRVPIKNLGASGNTTLDLLDRFERDVLPFKPRVLVIMSGVNDYRAQTFGATTVRRLAALRDKCNMYGIIPVFATTTPINPWLMQRAGIEQPPSDWQVHLQYINHWIMEQKYAVDITPDITDSDGNLRSDYTTDGLHPDYYGKKYIGEQIGHYLLNHFMWLTQNIK